MKRDTLKKNLIFQGLGGFGARIGSLIFTIILARLLIPSSFGIYNLVLTIILSLTVLIDFGLGITIVKFIASSKTKKHARSRFLFLFKIKFIWSLTLSILVLLSSKLISIFYNAPLLEIPLKIGAIYLFLNSMNTVLGSIFLATEKMKYTASMEFIFQILRVLLVLLFLSKVDNEISMIMLFLAIAMGVAIIFGTGVVIKKFNYLFKGVTNSVERRKMLKFSGFITVSSLSVMVFSNIDKLYLGYFADIRFVGYYAVILSLMSGAMGSFSALGVFFPRFILTAKGNLQENFRKTVKFISIIAIPATCGLAYLTLNFIKLLYGPEYVPQEHYLPLMLTSVALSLLIFEGVINGLFKMLLDSRDHAKTTAWGMGLATILNVILNPLLILYFLRFGEGYALLGVALATVISKYFNFGHMILAVRSKLKVTLKFKTFLKPMFSSILMILFLVILQPFFVSWKLFILLFLGAAFYFLVMLILKGIDFKEFTKFINQF